MLKWIPLMLAALVILTTGCKKSEPAKTETTADTSVVLPDPPELDSLDDAFLEDEADFSDEPVKKPAKETAKPANPAQGIVKDGAYTLQVGIYNSEKQAQKRAETLKNQGFPAYVARVEDPTPALSGTYYRVRIGSFATSKAARDYGTANLTPAGIDFWADLKGRDSQPVHPTYKPKAGAAPAPTQAPAAPRPAPAYTPAPAAPATPTPATPAQPADESQPAPKLPDW